MAAAYLFHVAQNHPFVDGNKRTGTAAALVFLRLNGLDIPKASERALEKIVVGVAKGKVKKATLAEFFRRYASKRGKPPVRRGKARTQHRQA